LLASYNAQNQVELRLEPAPQETLQEVQWQKTINNGSLTNLGTSKQPTYLDETAFNETEPPCYQATYTDSCGLTSANSTPACPVILKGNFNEKEGAVTLNWSEYIGFTGMPQYTLEVLDATTQQLLTTYPVSSNFTYRDAQLSPTSQILAYRIKVSAPLGVSYSNQVRIAQGFSAYIPTAFSPNNDGLNDIFEVKGRFINSVRMKIYNRSGQIIFESKRPDEGWNGLVNGKPAPVGTYIFSMTAQDLNGKTVSRTGSVTLVK
jgi:gliding motility-associated-like protein